MTQNKRFTCELCNRDFSVLDCHKYEQQNYVAYICPTCSLITANDYQKKRLVKKTMHKSIQQSNPEMQQIHQTLSGLITLGSIFLVTSLVTLCIVNLDNTIPSIYSLIKYAN